MLHTADTLRLYHGDVAPRNIFLRPAAGGEMEVWLGDLGIASHNHPYGMKPSFVDIKYSASTAPEVRLLVPGSLATIYCGRDGGIEAILDWSLLGACRW